MGFGKTDAGGWVVTQVNVDVIPPAIGSRDLGDRAIDLSVLGVLRIDAHDGAFGRGPGGLPLADVDIVGAAVESVADKDVAVGNLVGQATVAHPAGETRKKGR